MYSRKSINLISSVSPDVNSISLFINENCTLKASTVPEGFESESLLWESSVNNKSNKDILVTRFEIIDSKTNKIVTYTEDADEPGIVSANSSKSIGYRVAGVYKPILKWYFTYNGEEYQLSYSLQP